MDVRLIKPGEAKKLNTFVEGHPQGSIEQTWHWGELQKSIPGREEFFVVGIFAGKEDSTATGELMASCLCIRQHMGHGKTWLWCPGGPLLPGEAREDRWKSLLAVIENQAAEAGDVFLRIEPNLRDDEEVDLGGRGSKESYIPRHSLMVDLSKDEEAILKQMAQKGRYNIKKAAKENVIVTEGGIEDLNEAYAILEETAERDGFHLHQAEYYAAFLEVPGSHLYVAHVGEEIIGAAFVMQLGGMATYYFGASANKHRKAMAPYAMQWFAMQEAKKAGCATYDFLGIAPAGKAGEKHVLKGVTQFKTRFGGERVNYQEARVFVFKPVWWWLRKLRKMLG